MRHIDLTFSAVGWIKQTVQVADDFDATDLAARLERGELLTTIVEGGTLEVTATGQVLGTVIDVENNLEYEQFELATEI